MTVHFTRRPVWKPVEGARKVRAICPRCNCDVEFELVSDCFGTPFLGLINLKRNTIFGLHCPICVHVEEIPKNMSKELLKK
jgi:hypothetical protein